MEDFITMKLQDYTTVYRKRSIFKCKFKCHQQTADATPILTNHKHSYATRQYICLLSPQLEIKLNQAFTKINVFVVAKSNEDAMLDILYVASYKRRYFYLLVYYASNMYSVLSASSCNLQ